LCEIFKKLELNSRIAKGKKKMSESGGQRKRTLDDLLKEIQSQPLKVSNVGSAISGSGSGDFHQYRMQRRAEMGRVGKMKAESLEEERQREFMRRKEANELEAQERTRKLAEKRRRKKERKREGGKGKEENEKKEEDQDQQE
jgi:hypothetical protein